MKVTELIKQLNHSDERSNLEVKRGTHIDKSILETICAFSNEPNLGGGFIALGIEEADSSLFPTYQVAGVDNPDKLQRDLATQCADLFNIPVRPRISVEEINGLNVLLIDVSELPPEQKPLYFKKQGLPQGAFRRIGTTDQRCTKDDLFFFYGKEDAFDSSIIKDSSLDDISLEALELYRNLRSKANSAAEDLTYGDVDLLQALNCIKKENEEWRLTNAGLIVFGKRMSIRRLMPMMRIDYIRLSGKIWVENPEERFTETLDLKGPIIEIVSRVVSTIIDDLPKGFSLQSDAIQAKSKSILPLRVIREAIVNALIHRTYRVSQPIQILRYANRIEIINAGYSLKPENSIGEPGSVNRNPFIAAIFHDTNLAETKGSGFRTMQELMKASNMLAPTFESNREKNNFTLRLLFHNLLNKADIDWLETFNSYNLNDHQKLALVFLREVGAIDNNSYRQISGAKRAEAGTDLRILRKKNLIQQKKAGKSTYYLPTSTCLSTMVDNNDAMVDNSSDINGIKKEMPVEITLMIKEIGKRSKNIDLLKTTILRLCKWKELSIAELAQLLERNEKYIKNNYIQLLIDEGKISYTIPAMISHPQQKYKTIKMSNNKIWLSLAQMGGHEQQFIQEAFDTNWVVPLGPNVNGFEEDLKQFLQKEVHIVALSSGTAALHLALVQLGVERDDEVICQSFTFAASANPIKYVGATPVFIDSEADTWNMSPKFLKAAIKDRIAKTGKKPKTIIPVHLYGMPAKMDEIMAIANEYEIPVLEDAAEALGSEYKGQKCGTFGQFACLSFNGNKMITTSGGGALVCKSQEEAKRTMFFATQARDNAPHYEHSQIGYNYRMSNICAGIGRGQMMVLDEHVARRRAIHALYKKELSGIDGITVFDNPNTDFNSNHWLSCIIVNPEKAGFSREDIRLKMEAENIETRPLWKPMHLQPVFADAPYYGDGTSERLFNDGLCLPSGSSLSDKDIERVINVVKTM